MHPHRGHSLQVESSGGLHATLVQQYSSLTLQALKYMPRHRLLFQTLDLNIKAF